MRRIYSYVLMVALLSISTLPGIANAHQGHVRARVGVGFYFGPGYYYPPPYYYPPAVYYPHVPVVVNQPAPVYVEQAPAPSNSASTQASSGDWFYCPASKTYYPYVKECSEAWQRVPAVPQSNP